MSKVGPAWGVPDYLKGKPYESRLTNEAPARVFHQGPQRNQIAATRPFVVSQSYTLLQLASLRHASTQRFRNASCLYDIQQSKTARETICLTLQEALVA